LDSRTPSSLPHSETSAKDSPEPASDSNPSKSAPESVTLDGQALREWFHLPRFNQSDGLDDYNGDYRGFDPLGEVVTAHLRHRIQRLTEAPPDDRCPPTSGQYVPAQSCTAPAGNQDLKADAEEITARAPRTEENPDNESFRQVTRMLTSIRTAACNGAKEVCAAFCNGTMPDAFPERLAKRLPEAVMVMGDDLPAAAGPEAWLGALAMGASRVFLLGSGATQVQQDPLRLARAVLADLKLDPEARLLMLPEDTSEACIGQAPAPLEPAAWEPAGDERTLLWQAVTHLHSQVTDGPDQTPLEQGAPFGAVAVETARCTLCLACVGACPTHALHHATPGPQIRFRERDCTQCGRCRQVCPEQAVTLIPRICYDPQLTGRARILHQDTPMRCSVCGVPFATAGIVAAVARRLSSHWMYQDPTAQARLTMCRDCRIRNFYAAAHLPPVRETGREK
jgi:ferredoxin